MVKYDVYLDGKKVRSCLSEKDSKLVVGNLRAGQAIKQLQGKKTLNVERRVIKKRAKKKPVSFQNNLVNTLDKMFK